MFNVSKEDGYTNVSHPKGDFSSGLSNVKFQDGAFLELVKEYDLSLTEVADMYVWHGDNAMIVSSGNPIEENAVDVGIEGELELVMKITSMIRNNSKYKGLRRSERAYV